MGVVDAVAQGGGRRCELDPGVHTFRLAGIGCDVDGDAVARDDEVADGVREVQLTLRIRRSEALERGPQQLGLEHVDGRVRLADRKLRGRRVGGLDDRLEVSVLPAHDPPVGADLARLEREHRRARAPRAVRFEQVAQKLGRQERRIAREHQHLVGACDRLPGAADGVARAERPLLDGDGEPVEAVGRLG